MSALKIAAIQFDIQWLNKSANLNYLDSVLTQLESVDLILLPETFSTGFSIDVVGCEEPAEQGDVLAWMLHKAKHNNCVVAGSILVAHKNKKANRFYWVYPDGQVEYYDKRHLFRLGKEQDHVVQGDARKIFTINNVRILPIVCYDLRFPVWSRNKQDYDVIVNVANWPAVRRNVWDILLQARAIENQAFVVGLNRIGQDAKGVAHSGGTAAYDYTGKTIAQVKDDSSEVMIVTLDISKLNEFKNAFPAYLDADNFEVLGDRF